MKRITLLLITCFALNSYSQSSQKVDFKDLILPKKSEIKEDNKTKISAWWISKSYWKAALKEHSTYSKEEIQRIEKELEYFSVIAISNHSLSANPDRTFVISNDKGDGSPILKHEHLHDDLLDALKKVEPVVLKRMGKTTEEITLHLNECHHGTAHEDAHKHQCLLHNDQKLH